jgi:hypothetical protein
MHQAARIARTLEMSESLERNMLQYMKNLARRRKRLMMVQVRNKWGVILRHLSDNT